jgi:uncharacterized protein (TIRG00374 family)
MFWFFDTQSIYALSNFVHLRLPWLESLKIALIGQFYGAITPCMSGSQPSQMVYMTKKNVPGVKSTPLLVSKFLLWQIVEGFVATISIPFCWSRVASDNSGLVAVALIGYALNSLAIVGGILILVNQKVVMAICRFVARVGLKLHLIHDSESWIEKTQHFAEGYGESIKLLLADKKKAIISLLFVFGQLVSLFIVTYFIYLACTSEPFSIGKMFDVFFMQSVLTISVNFIPLPGANGTSEGGFYLLFGQLFPGHMVFIGMILWRFVTYYFNLLGGFLAILSGTFFGISRNFKKGAVQKLGD